MIYNSGAARCGFLMASALWWIRTFHLDGLRVDAVASMLYRDYSRQPGEWIPNVHGGRENLEAVSFLQRAERPLSAEHPGAVVIAEESTAWPGVTAPTDEDGLGFHFKWNMGWMHDTLRLLRARPDPPQPPPRTT
jgi:1,4-alpha-glucan branching enzyme